ncbi:MAG: hypothetical protein J6H21_05075 [Firmicutes bacterium]|nr:hypothetical protein [Bacillota bacterium]
MLGKLIKYEFKSTSRLMWYLYGALIIIGGLMGIMFRTNESGESSAMGYISMFGITGNNDTLTTIFVILTGVYALLVQAIFIMTVIMIVSRFYKNLLGGEGYLMHTLPVKTHNLIISKGIVAIIWGVIAVISGIMSGFLFSITSGILGRMFNELTWERFKLFLSEILTPNALLGIVLIIVGSITEILIFYFAMSIGNLANKNKFLYSVLAYIGIQIVSSVVFSIIGVNQGGLIGMIIDESSLSQFLIMQIVQRLILGVAFFFGTNYILKNKLNLA